MKKLIYVFSTLTALSSNISTQTNTFPTNGNVGIGTTSATAKITFNNVNDGSNLPDGITWYGPNPLNYGIYRTAGPWEAPYQQLKLNWETGIILNPGAVGSKSYVDISGGGLRVSSGNVGLGTLNPEAKLNIVDAPNGPNSGSLIIGSTNATNLRMGCTATYSWIQAHWGLPLRINELGNNLILNLNAGNVGIGIENPQEKLAVNGTIRTKEIKVEAANWPDYVFEEGYKIETLEKLESYIKANKHLPDMPSAKEVEANGVALGEMNKLLLKKVEELTLHLIEKDKEITTQLLLLKMEEKRNTEQEKRLSKLENMVLNLKNVE